MLGRHLYFAVVILFASGGPSSAQCDLSSIVAVAQSRIASESFDAIITISGQRIALVKYPETPLEPWNMKGVPLLELRDDTTVEVGSVELLWSSGLLERFRELTEGADLELVIGKSQSVLLGDQNCIGVEWQATPISSSYYTLEDVELETRFTVGQVYSAVLSESDLRDEVVPTVSLDLRYGEHLSERLTQLPEIQSSIVVRPYLGRLSIYEIHIPTSALRTPSETWLSDEISYLSRIEAEEWRLGRALPEFSIRHADDNAVLAGAYFPISDVWSGEFQVSSKASTQTYFAIERAYLWPSREIYGSIVMGQFEDIGQGVFFNAGRDFGKSQIGISLGVAKSGSTKAAMLERSIDTNTEAWILIEAEKHDLNFMLGMKHRLNSSAGVDVSMLRNSGDEAMKIKIGFSLTTGGKNSSIISIGVGEKNKKLTMLSRNSAAIRMARKETLNKAWFNFLD